MSKRGTQRNLYPLNPGSRVWIQNQVTLDWDRSGTVIEALRHRQYSVRLDGSGRLSRRNRTHLKPISETPTSTLPPVVKPTTVPRSVSDNLAASDNSEIPYRISRPRRKTRKLARLNYK